MSSFLALFDRIDEAKKRPAPITRADVDRWLRSVEELAKDIAEFKRVKGITDKKIADLERRHKEAKNKADRLRKQHDEEKARVTADLLRAKRDKDERKPDDKKSDERKPDDRSYAKNKKPNTVQKKPKPKRI